MEWTEKNQFFFILDTRQTKDKAKAIKLGQYIKGPNGELFARELNNKISRVAYIFLLFMND